MQKQMLKNKDLDFFLPLFLWDWGMIVQRQERNHKEERTGSQYSKYHSCYSNKEKHKNNSIFPTVTEPTNMKVCATRTGRIKSSYFGPLSFTTVGDPYIDPEKVLVHYEKEQKKLCNKEAPFKPPSGYKELMGSAYQHMKDYDYKKVESRKQTDGRVYSAPRNVSTNPRCKVLDKSLPYMMDDYNRYSDFERKARMQSKSKEKEQPFRSTVNGGQTFEKDKSLYGQTKMPATSQRKSPELKQAKHESAFRPVNGLKKGFEGLFGHFEYR